MNRRRQKANKPLQRSSSLSYSSSTLTVSWVPLTLILLLYTTGLSIGETASDGKPEGSAGEDGDKNVTKLNYTKTGNPQIDYIHDPNLPRELNGYNLSSYPFFSRVPEPAALNFSCEGLKDGFYASIEHKCQVYHHCLFGTRYDFLCANYTAFDQKTFICQFVSEVDCPNSALFFHRNDALYVTKSTPAPEVLYAVRPNRDQYIRRPGKHSAFTPKLQGESGARPASVGASDSDAGTDSDLPSKRDRDAEYDSEEEEYDERPVRPRRKKPKPKRRCRGRRDRQCRRRARPPPRRVRPVYDDEYDDDYEYDDYYPDDDYEYESRPRKKPTKKPRKGGGKVASSIQVESLVSTTEKGEAEEVASASKKPVSTTRTAIVESNTEEELEVLEPLDPVALKVTRGQILNKQSRPAPRVRLSAKKVEVPEGRSVPSPNQKSQNEASKTASATYDEYYEDEDPVQPSTTAPRRTTTTTTTTTTVPPTPEPTTPSTTRVPRTRLNQFKTKPPTSARPAARSRSSTTTTSTTTTETPTTSSTLTTSVATTFKPFPLRSTTPKTYGTSASTTESTTTTTTTTELPEYEYEYTYEDELPVEQALSLSSTERSSPQTTPTTTTTTTTTPKPSRISNSNTRAKRPYPPLSSIGGSSSLSSIQSSTSVSVQDPEPYDDGTDTPSNAIQRRGATSSRNQRFRNNPTSNIPTVNSIVSTSERFPTKELQDYRSQAPVITVKTAPSQQPILSSTSSSSSRSSSSGGNLGNSEPPVTRARPSRFWQRPAKVVPSSTTTTEASGDYADYSDEPETLPVPAPPPAPPSRYNNANSNANSNRYRGGSSSLSSSSPTTSYSQTQSSSDDPYDSNAQYSRIPVNNQYAAQVNDNQFLRPTQNTYRQQSSTRSSIDPNNYISSPYGVGPSSALATSSARPEFISLLRDDEDPYYDIPSQRSPPLQSNGGSSSRRLPNPQRPQYFGAQPYHQTQTKLYGAAQEAYPTYVSPPPRFSPSTVGFMNEMNMGFRAQAQHPSSIIYGPPPSNRRSPHPQHHMLFHM